MSSLQVGLTGCTPSKIQHLRALLREFLGAGTEFSDSAVTNHPLGYISFTNLSYFIVNSTPAPGSAVVHWATHGMVNIDELIRGLQNEVYGVAAVPEAAGAVDGSRPVDP